MKVKAIAPMIIEVKKAGESIEIIAELHDQDNDIPYDRLELILEPLAAQKLMHALEAHRSWIDMLAEEEERRFDLVPHPSREA